MLVTLRVKGLWKDNLLMTSSLHNNEFCFPETLNVI